jgi:O-antigen/teichoic acid export membrane protein
VSTPDRENVLALSATELDHTPGAPGTAEELMVGDEVADVLASREAGGIAVRGGAMRVAGYILNSALGAVAGAFLFRHLGTKNAGTYVTALSIAAVVAGLSDLGLTALGLRELSILNLSGRMRLMSNLLGLRIVLAVIGVGGSVIFSVLVGYKPVLVAGVALAGAGLLVNIIQGTLSLSLMSRLRLGLLTATETARQLLMTGFTIALVALGAGVLSFIGLAIPVGVVILVITAWLVRGEVPLLPRFDRGEWRRLAREILPFSVLTILTLLYFRLSVIVMSLVASQEQLSYFGLSFRIIEILVVIPTVMVTGVFPIFARSAVHDRERLAYAVSRVFVVAAIVGVWFTITLAIGAPVAIKLIGGSEFAQATGVLRIQAFGLGAAFVGAVWGITLISLRRYRQLVLFTLGTLAVGTVLVVVLASSHGAQGAALATTITEVAGAVSIPFVLLKRSDPQVVPSMAMLPRVALAAGLAALVVFIPGIPVVAAVLVASVAYFGTLVVVRAIPEELLQELRNLHPRYRSRGSEA